MINLPSTTWDSLNGLRVLVIGDAMLDSYFNGSSQRLCQEAPVPIVDVAQRHDMPGGAANSAANLAAIGATPLLLGLTGDDPDGDRLRELLAQKGISADSLITSSRRRTLHKVRVLCDDHLVVRFDEGSTEPASKEDEQIILKRLDNLFPQSDLIMVSDYGYGVSTPALIDRLAWLQRRLPRILAVDAKNLIAYRHVGMTACKPNYRQTTALLGLEATGNDRRRVNALYQHGKSLLDGTGSQVVAVSLDCEGALIFERDRPPYRTHAHPAPQNRVAGAGDTFLSMLAAALAIKLPTPAAAEMASAAAAVAVAKSHTATCSQEELKEFLTGTQFRENSLRRVLPALDECRRTNRRIVLTSGCFDILHRGHVTYLSQAKHLGDVLVVGVNSDDSIRRLKGSGRPINALADRMSMLSALADVDYVVSFDEDTPHHLIEAVRPDIFVKGGDYTRDTLPEAELVERLGGAIEFIPFSFDRSTTRIIKNICSAYGNPLETAKQFVLGDGYANQGLAVGAAPAVH